MTNTSRLITFTTKDGDIPIECNTSCTIDQMLDIFLLKTNSIRDKDTQKISFMYLGKILNSERNLNKTISQLKIINNCKIKVIDHGNIVGGNK